MAGTKAIALSGKRGEGKNMLVDDDVYAAYGHLLWHLSDTGYVIRRTRQGTIRLHRLVANTPTGLNTDHKNHDRLDNRRANLRVVTPKENMANFKGAKGYCWDNSKKLWVVTYKAKFYGRYKTEEEARLAAKLSRSGVPKQTQTHPRRSYLPKGVQFMLGNARRGAAAYYINPMRQGKRHFKGYFKTIVEAETAYNNFILGEG